MATPMMQQYHRIKQQYPEDVIFFRMGDFFEMFHDDAITAHEILGITLTRRNHGKGKEAEVPLAGFPHHQLEPYLARMTRAGKRVVVVEQVEDPKQAKGLVKRDIVRIVTAGTNFSEESLEGGRNQFLAGIVLEKREAGLALCDATTGEFQCATLPRASLPDLLEMLQPAEIIYDDEQRDDIRELGHQGGMRTPLEPWLFDPGFARDTLTAHFK
ncbi:DNA mismatch repair protein MutS, partial [bacterium]|nr:DNA mismatch repair protein MutS [bacterium]